jgi:hypothetical protein
VEGVVPVVVVGWGLAAIVVAHFCAHHAFLVILVHLFVDFRAVAAGNRVADPGVA